jgi:hypothetical protein
VQHWIIAWASGEEPGDEETLEIVETFLADLNLARSQYLAVVHGDTDNRHVHIVANRVVDGKAINMGLSGVRAIKSMARQSLERGWDIVKNRHNAAESRQQALARRLSDSQFSSYWRSDSDTLTHWLEATPGAPHLTTRERAQIAKGQLPLHVEYGDIIRSAVTASADWTSFMKTCETAGLRVGIEVSRRNKKTGQLIPGVRFQTMDGKRGASGTTVCAPYQCLAQKFGADHPDVRDALATSTAPAPAALSPSHLDAPSSSAPDVTVTWKSRSRASSHAEGKIHSRADYFDRTPVDPNIMRLRRRREIHFARFDTTSAAAPTGCSNVAGGNSHERSHGPTLMARPPADDNAAKESVASFIADYLRTIETARETSNDWASFIHQCRRAGINCFVTAKLGKGGLVYPGVRFQTLDESRGAAGSKVGAAYRRLREKFGDHITVAEARNSASACPAPSASAYMPAPSSQQGRERAAEREASTTQSSSKPGQFQELRVGWKEAFSAHKGKMAQKIAARRAAAWEEETKRRKAEISAIYAQRPWVELAIRVFLPPMMRGAILRLYRAGLRRNADARRREQRVRWAKVLVEIKSKSWITFPQYLENQIFAADNRTGADAARLLQKFDPESARRIPAIIEQFDAMYGEKADKMLTRNFFGSAAATPCLIAANSEHDDPRHRSWYWIWLERRAATLADRSAESTKQAEQDRQYVDARARIAMAEADERATIRRIVDKVRGNRPRHGGVHLATPAVRQRLDAIRTRLIAALKRNYWDQIIHELAKPLNSCADATTVVTKLELSQKDRTPFRRRWLTAFITAEMPTLRRLAREKRDENDRGLFGDPSAVSSVKQSPAPLIGNTSGRFPAIVTPPLTPPTTPLPPPAVDPLTTSTTAPTPAEPEPPVDHPVKAPPTPPAFTEPPSPTAPIIETFGAPPPRAAKIRSDDEPIIPFVTKGARTGGEKSPIQAVMDQDPWKSLGLGEAHVRLWRARVAPRTPTRLHKEIMASLDAIYPQLLEWWKTAPAETKDGFRALPLPGRKQFMADLISLGAADPRRNRRPRNPETEIE